MRRFEYTQRSLHAEAVPVETIADAVGTPFYCYSSAAVRDNYQAYAEHFRADRSLICYALKANSNQAVIGTLAKMGAGADVVSEGELRRALLAGIPAHKIVFSGVAKTRPEMEFALRQGIFQFNVESEPELEQLDSVARALDVQAPIALRINPDIDAKTHAKIATGRADDKFGIPWTRAHAAYARAAQLPGIAIQGIDIHIGSQLTTIEPFERAFSRLATLAEELIDDGYPISVLDVGGGLGISYNDGNGHPPTRSQYAALVEQILGPLDCKTIVEPGRSIVGDAGILVTQVVYVKRGETEEFLIVDAGMNDLLRPSMYDAFHEVVPVRRSDARPVRYQVVGPVCETGDTLAHSRMLPRQSAGDLVVLKNVGAYGAVMASVYNSRPLVPEVLVDGDEFTVVRKRQSYAELIGMDLPAES